MGEWPDHKQVEPTEDEKRNGWTAETLSKYLHDREQANSRSLDWKERPKAKPRVANSRYSPFRFRS